MFILIEVANREINAEKHDTLKEAQDAMHELYDEHHDKDHFGGIDEYNAHLVPRFPARGLYDWKIIEL